MHQHTTTLNTPSSPLQAQHFTLNTIVTQLSPSNNMPKTWTPLEERQLLDLHDKDKPPWSQIAEMLSRTQTSCQQRYDKLREERAANLVAWTPSLDQALIDAKSHGLHAQAIAADLEIPVKAVPGRWNQLKSEGRVPEEMLGEPQHKDVEPWTHEQDVQILELYIALVNDRGIWEKAKFENRSMKEVQERRIWWVNHDPSGLYRGMLPMIGSMRRGSMD
jgi:hypothetical protein